MIIYGQNKIFFIVSSIFVNFWLNFFDYIFFIRWKPIKIWDIRYNGAIGLPCCVGRETGGSWGPYRPSGRNLVPTLVVGREPILPPPPRKKNTLDKQAIMSYTFKCITTRKFLVRNVLFLLTKKTQIEKKNWIPKSD